MKRVGDPLKLIRKTAIIAERWGVGAYVPERYHRQTALLVTAGMPGVGHQYDRKANNGLGLYPVGGDPSKRKQL